MPDNFSRIEELFHQALQIEPGKRNAFVAEVHSTDPDLGRELESLLEAHSQDKSLIDSPAYEAAADLIAESETQIITHRKLGRYLVLGPIGKGGMGEVFIADDPQLGRKVALKLLPAALTANKDRMRRFIQEARAASALNHPNILTIHEIGESEGTHFIATEFIEGDTLRKRLSRGRLPLNEVLDIAIQAASAIEAAHSAGIVHRDIKPENVMLRKDGYVKVLDFGLAKLAAPTRSAGIQADSQVPTAVINGTEPGLVVGTPNYMSPEQARAVDVDARSDIFSLGIVIYEMAAGRAAFTGDTPADVIVSILQTEPPPLTELDRKPPPELERIVRKALSKDRDQRYQTTTEMLGDLKDLRDEIAFEEKKAKSQSHVQGAVASVAPSTLSKNRVLVVAASVLAIIAIASIAAVFLWPRSEPDAVPPPALSTSERSLTYWIQVQKYRDGKPYQDPFRLRDDINFEKDYQVRLNISSSQTGYLYLLNEGPGISNLAPSYILMFPTVTSNQFSAVLKENQQIQIPEQSWFQFDEKQGTEKIWLVWADQAVDKLEAVKVYSNARDRGLISDPESRSRIYEFLKSHSASRPSIERDQDKTETALRVNGNVLVHVINLSHY